MLGKRVSWWFDDYSFQYWRGHEKENKKTRANAVQLVRKLIKEYWKCSLGNVQLRRPFLKEKLMPGFDLMIYAIPKIDKKKEYSDGESWSQCVSMCSCTTLVHCITLDRRNKSWLTHHQPKQCKMALGL